jgi:hypothetical protein
MWRSITRKVATGTVGASERLALGGLHDDGPPNAVQRTDEAIAQIVATQREDAAALQDAQPVRKASKTERAVGTSRDRCSGSELPVHTMCVSSEADWAAKRLRTSATPPL